MAREAVIFVSVFLIFWRIGASALFLKFLRHIEYNNILFAAQNLMDQNWKLF